MRSISSRSDRGVDTDVRPAAPSAHPTFTPPTPVADPRLQQAAAQLGHQMQQEQGMVSEAKACEQVWQTRENCVVYLDDRTAHPAGMAAAVPHTDFFFAKNATLINNSDQQRC